MMAVQTFCSGSARSSGGGVRFRGGALPTRCGARGMISRSARDFRPRCEIGNCSFNRFPTAENLGEQSRRIYVLFSTNEWLTGGAANGEPARAGAPCPWRRPPPCLAVAKSGDVAFAALQVVDNLVVQDKTTYLSSGPLVKKRSTRF